MHFFRVRQDVWCARHVAQNSLWRGHFVRLGQVIRERRIEERLSRVFLDFPRIFLINRLIRVTARQGGRVEFDLLGQNRRAT